MSTFLINLSNLKVGGGLQVADSVCRQLFRFPQHHFVCVLSTKLSGLKDQLDKINNIEVVTYDIQNGFLNLALGRDAFLDALVSEFHVDAVLTIFGPSRWRPQVPHLCGFARAQLLLTDSPYYKMIGWKERLRYKVWKWGFRRSSKLFYTENPYISDMLPQLLGKDIKVYTVTNYYNQIFDEQDKWGRSYDLTPFDGITLLAIGNTGAHKNLSIAYDIVKTFQKVYPEMYIRFVLTVTEKAFLDMLHSEYDINLIREHFVFLGTVDVAECPHLYEQVDIMFMPTLMECFTATYPEAMRMEVPIVTTDLEFARGLCGDAACYYSAIDAKAAAEAIYKVATDKVYAKRLVENGKKQLLKYDNYEQRTEKLINILEEIV